MTRLNREEFNQFRKEKKQELDNSSIDSDNVYILIGMGSCGVAAGARLTMKVFTDEINEKGLQNIIVKQTGCMGYCAYEPTVEVRVPGMPPAIYGKIAGELAKKIIDKHVINKKMLNGYILDKPSIDIME